MPGPERRPPSLGYEFDREAEARARAAELDRRFAREEIVGLRVYRVRWSGNYIVEATFADDVPQGRMRDARALLGESGVPVHPDDLTDYKRASEGGGLPGWMRRFFGGQ
ncbi:hypothetical protein GBA65_06735 [Rubrobacter marinus]|uniref:Uncharacterized protein n=1 Tax=Rubrobacter marinus TaxID=2653852 RepID=A0A6G8PVQ4_9ACTN|nr:hypothetical protein [Rubrobacter marinus]QIN78255.1 hypothetical protein GBA65_06735 [Rubrobacter marinus]